MTTVLVPCHVCQSQSIPTQGGDQCRNMSNTSSLFAWTCSFMGDVNVVNPKHYTTSRKTYIAALTLEMDMSK